MSIRRRRIGEAAALGAALALVATTLSGCVNEQLEIGEGAAGDTGTDGPATGGAPGPSIWSSEDPGAIRSGGIPEGAGPYGYCSAGRNYAVPDCSNGGIRFGFDECSAACACSGGECESDADCPVPATGSPSPYCRIPDGEENGDCQMRCGDGEVCPDGMTCLIRGPDEICPPGDTCPHDPEYEAMCVWLETGEENFNCWVDWHVHPDDYCSQFTTKDDCERRLETSPMTPMMACVWARESVYSTGSDSCEPVTSEQKCVLATGSGDFCEEGASCSSSLPAVFWGDVGADTSVLVEVDSCHYKPDPTENVAYFEACEFGDPTLPGLCDCACGE